MRSHRPTVSTRFGRAPTSADTVVASVLAVRILLVVNSFASSVTARNTVVVHRRLARGHDVEVVETNRRGHATRFAHDAARRGVDVVIGYGGDGTLNEVATGIAGTDTALGVLPGGSTNVFARTLGLPNDPVAGRRPARPRHRRRRPAADRPRPGQRPLLLLPHRHRLRRRRGEGGRAARVAEAVARPPAVHLGRAHDVAPRVRPAPARTSGSPPTGRRRDGSTASTTATSRSCSTPIPYTYLGNRPLDLSPAATLDNPLVVVTFSTLRVLPILRGLGSALRGGGVKESAHVTEWRDVEHMVVEHAQPFPYQVDGDYLGDVEPARVRLRAGRGAARVPRRNVTPSTPRADREARHRARWCRCRRRPTRSARGCGPGRRRSTC